MVMETYAPAAVLINRKHECLYSLGPTDRYLRVAPGYPTHDLLAMAREDCAPSSGRRSSGPARRMRAVVVPGGRMQRRWQRDFVQHRRSAGSERRRGAAADLLRRRAEAGAEARSRRRPAEDAAAGRRARAGARSHADRAAGAIRNLEISSEEQKAINEEALSVNEEYQSTNEELLTSKEELQSLNEELTALNSQLQETLERQRTTSNDLQNVLYSTDVATIFLDTDLNIRFFTPATKSLFSVIPSDVGRPLADLNSLAADSTLLADAQTVLRTLRADRAGDRSAERRLVHPPHPALPHPGQRGRGRRHHLCRHHRAAAHRGRAGGGQAAGGTGQCRQIALSRRREPRPAPAAADACPASGAAGEGRRGREGAEAGRAARRDVGRHVGHAEHAARHQPDRGRHRPRRNRSTFPINDLLDRLRDEFTYHAQAQRADLACGPVRPVDPQRSAPARADDPQPAFERPEIHQARQGAARVAGAAQAC